MFWEGFVNSVNVKEATKESETTQNWILQIERMNIFTFIKLNV